MDNQILSAVLADYAARRERGEREEARREEEIRTLHPDLYALTVQRHEMVLRSVRAGLQGAAADPEKEMAAFNEKIAAMLEEKGYPRDYLGPVCDCPLCRDTGYVYEQSRRVPCACLKKAYQTALEEAGSSMQPGERFESFDLNRFPDVSLPNTDVTQREYMRIVRDKCRAFADQVPGGALRTLLLHGGSGLGKTFLLNCVGHAVRDRGVDVTCVTAYDLLMALKTAYFSRAGEASAQPFFDVTLLLIDDLGMEPLMEGVTVEQIYNLLNSRISRGLYTAITSNLNRTQLEQKYTERVTSRLLDKRSGLAIPFLGRDIRLLKA